MARISYTSIKDIDLINRFKIRLGLIKRKIEGNNYYLNKKNFIEQIKNLIILVKNIKEFANNRPVIFKPDDIDYLESLDIVYHNFLEDIELNDEDIKILNNNLLNILRIKHEKYKKIYSLNK